ncbi:trigger factor [Rhodobacter capsulatus]|uniref:Trigger factor n=1 Tax=Rhodobacter capsulatus (strain ATCC BAA-309 / NBRC 16581 / SB1003) TaxID=272942 RepID=TIG_RHOCB|nr:trigger factor [Rhodobacter capsulatus]O68129.1 RecName: Full=Trigger factor; Short=TF; AltName: Full=PPIase [Rhodobacter capsulatus SB 1003]AAC16219.1 trigger factor [Rhodobacter capsulatus SB 1003]ADE85752.1 trigger factor [Rhodobacter capsulatus SB 1003]ETD01755.1 trigger factor [Rhodobacter capsulatus DE442]ETD76823.1 trigger factor [Rhodobacter capsulatus R121]ETE53660.1 trigger factor [Rhodobacter capsulatus Y262]
MQVTQTLNEGLKRGYTITLTGAELDAKVTEKLIEVQPEVEIKGFRKGKVPMAMLRKNFGDRVLGDVLNESVDGAIKDLLDQSGDRPALQPKVEMENGKDWKPGTDAIFTVSYEALPPIPAFDRATVTLERLVVKADEASVTEALENLAKSAQAFEDRKKGTKAKDGDQVVIDFEGFLGDEPFEGGKGEEYPLVLGSNSFIPGFEDQLVGAKAGEDVEVKVTFPAEYGAAHLAGKEATFKCHVHAVKAPKPAEIDDELAKKFGAADLEALKGQVASRLEAEYKGASRAILKRALLDILDAQVKFDLPPSLVEAEAGQIAHQLWHEENPDHHGHDHGAVEPTEEHKTLAERRVRLGLLLAELGRNEKIEVTDAEMTQAVLAAARQYPGHEREFFEFVKGNAQMQQQIRAPLYEEKVIDFIVAGAAVTEKEVSKEELQKAIEALDEL